MIRHNPLRKIHRGLCFFRHSDSFWKMTMLYRRARLVCPLLALLGCARSSVLPEPVAPEVPVAGSPVFYTCDWIHQFLDDCLKQRPQYLCLRQPDCAQAHIWLQNRSGLDDCPNPVFASVRSYKRVHANLRKGGPLRNSSWKQDWTSLAIRHSGPLFRQGYKRSDSNRSSK